MQRCLGLDVGQVRIGIAITDPFGLFAQPLLVLDRRKDAITERLSELIADYDVGKVVVGYPLRMNGEQGIACEKMDGFVASLQLPAGVEVVTIDERLTSKQAEKILIGAGMRRERRKGAIDKLAAAILLQAYIDSQPSMEKR